MMIWYESTHRSAGTDLFLLRLARVQAMRAETFLTTFTPDTDQWAAVQRQVGRVWV